MDKVLIQRFLAMDEAFLMHFFEIDQDKRSYLYAYYKGCAESHRRVLNSISFKD